MPREKAMQMSANALAFLGDAVFELYVRKLVFGEGKHGTERMHKEKAAIVNAKAQAGLLARIAPLLTEEEQDIVRRGRNAKHHTTAKHQTVHDYNQATGLEALCGFLYLQGETVRLCELLRAGLPDSQMIRGSGNTIS